MTTTETYKGNVNASLVLEMRVTYHVSNVPMVPMDGLWNPNKVFVMVQTVFVEVYHHSLDTTPPID